MQKPEGALTPSEFLDAIQQGGQVLEQAVSRLFRSEYARLVRKVMKSVWNDKATADQIVQEAFLRLLTRSDQYRGEVAPAGYLTGIVLNLTVDHYRRHFNSREISWESDDAEDGNGMKDTFADEHAPSLDDILHNRQLAECIQRRLRGLDSKGADFMRVFSLVFEQEYKPAELAQALGRTPAATRQLIYTCRQKLRDLLKPCYRMLGGGEMEVSGHG